MKNKKYHTVGTVTYDMTTSPLCTEADRFER